MCMFEANLGARDLTAADYTHGSMKPRQRSHERLVPKKSENSVVLKPRQALLRNFLLKTVLKRNIVHLSLCLFKFVYVNWV